MMSGIRDSSEQESVRDLPLVPGLVGSDDLGAFLTAWQCEACGCVALGERAICPSCWSSAPRKALRIGRTGRVYSATLVHQAWDGFSAPYAIGYVDVEHGIRLLAHLEQAEGSPPAIGEAVSLQLAVLRRTTDGATHSGPCYKKGARA